RPASEATAAVDLQLVAPRERQVNQCQEVLVPANGDPILGHAAEAFEHALVEGTIDLAPVANRTRWISGTAGDVVRQRLDLPAVHRGAAGSFGEGGMRARVTPE